MSVRKVPQIRFKGFVDEWEEKKLFEVANHRGGTAIEKYFDENGLYKVISIGSYGLDSKYVDQNIRAISNEITQNRLVYKGELAMVLNDKTASGEIIGRSLLIECNDKYVINQRTEIISPKKTFDSQFAYVILNGSFREKVKRIVQGGTQIYVNYPVVENLSLTMPEIYEQKQIGNLFNNIDNLITIHQRKLELLKDTKKSMLQKMFPKEGATVPEIRFKGFTGDWEERKLGEVTSKIGSGKTPKGGASAYKDEGIYLIRSQNINFDRVDLFDVVYIDNKTDEDMRNSRVVYGDILLNITGASIGRCAVFRSNVNANVNQHVCIIRPKNKNYSPEFIQLNLISDKGEKQIDSYQAGGAREGLNFEQIGKMSFYFPNVVEQDRIGEYFKNIDMLIKFNQRKLNSLKTLKKSMLQKMFI